MNPTTGNSASSSSFNGTGAVTASNTPSVAATKQLAPTLKVVSNKSHLGPYSGVQQAKAQLSSAAGKILFNNNMKIVAANGSSTSNNKKPDTNTSQEIKLHVNSEIAEAGLYMLAWDRLYDLGTDSYKEKFEALQRARRQAYQDLGINPDGKDRPELTAQQRAMYNSKVQPFAFSYFEYRLSFKQPGKKVVRSTTYRSLQPLSMDAMVKNLTTKAMSLSKVITIKVKTQ